MVTVIHGDDTTAWLKKIDELLKGASSITRLNAKKNTTDEISSAFDSQELFSNKKTLVIEDIASSLPQGKEKIISQLVKQKDSKEVNVIVVQEGILDKKFLEKLKNFTIYSFFLPKYFFSFLDNLAPLRGKKLHELLSQMEKTFSEEQIFYAVVKRIRLLLIFQAGNQGELSETKNLAPWQITRLKAQAKLWKLHQLVTFYKKLFEVEVSLKTSSLPLSLRSHLDILLASEL